VSIGKGLAERAGSSARTDGSKPMFTDIWEANVPAKVHVFAWRLAHEGLATQVNRHARKMDTEAKCQICGKQDETGHHVVVRGIKANALRAKMRHHWELPEERLMQHDGHDWLPTLLSTLNKEAVRKPSSPFGAHGTCGTTLYMDPTRQQ
jgi:hypothetical protein